MIRKATTVVRTGTLAVAIFGTSLVAPLAAQQQVERNVVYGMYSGLALLMDVHRPAEPNGIGLIWIWGSGFHMPLEYGARQLKNRGVPSLYLDAGYTVFVINHRAAPRFRYPAGVEDVQRAARFVRYHARDYGIDPGHLGGWGGSSGAYMISMLGVMDGEGDPNDPDPVNRGSAKLQAVVARAAPEDLLHIDDSGFYPSTVLGSFLGAPPSGPEDPLYRAASPITYVTADDPPFLLVHGDADETVPFRQSELMLAALQTQDVDARLIRIAGGNHGANDLAETLRWLNQHLLGETQAAALEPLAAAFERLEEGRRLAITGDIAGALTAYRDAQSRSPRITVSVGDWYTLCRRGALWEHAADVLFACERAVELSPQDLMTRDSRALARALTGDVAGAIADFEFVVERARVGSTGRKDREGWVAELRGGRNPFTREVLERMRR